MGKAAYNPELCYDCLSITARLLANSRWGDKIILKGGLALLSTLKATPVYETIQERGTKDIDLHASTMEDLEYFATSCIDVLNQNTFGYKYTLIQLKVNRPESRTVLFDMEYQGQTVRLEMDIVLGDIKLVGIVATSGLGLMCYDNYTMLSDKILVLSSEKIFRRVKDVFDIYILANISDYRSSKLRQAIMLRHPSTFKSNFAVFNSEEAISKLRHAYSTLKGLEHAPDFDVVMRVVQSFVVPVISSNQEMIWHCGSWRVIR